MVNSYIIYKEICKLYKKKEISNLNFRLKVIE